VNDYGIRYCAGRKTAFAWDYTGSSNMEELNIILAETMMLRRLKSEVMKQLPPKLRYIYRNFYLFISGF
jgi:SWI/SNF-related matrix-associated actin-dependent regulator 1 of chromatin subfamily A